MITMYIKLWNFSRPCNYPWDDNEAAIEMAHTEISNHLLNKSEVER